MCVGLLQVLTVIVLLYVLYVVYMVLPTALGLLLVSYLLWALSKALEGGLNPE